MIGVSSFSFIARSVLLGAVLEGMALTASADPVVSNVTAAQKTDGTGRVDITYTLSGVLNTAMVSVSFSNDDGLHWNVLPTEARLSGDVGPGMVNGVGKHILWDASRERVGMYWPKTRARVTVGEIGQTLAVTLPGGVLLEMARIPAGNFEMGSAYDPGYSQSNETPAHTVTIPSEFQMGKYEVTQAQWNAVMGSVPDGQTQTGLNYPVAMVSWTMCQSFLTALNALGLGAFRLPSEAEWEYACRAGSNTQWSFGNDEAQLVDHAWYTVNSGNTVHIVGTKSPNAFGLYDMYGNVLEWVQDCYHATYAGAPTNGSAWESPTDIRGLLRGGGWNYSVLDCRSAARNYCGLDGAFNCFGFRVVRTP